MAKFNTTFELSVEDLDLIEYALRGTKQSLCRQRIEGLDATAALAQGRLVSAIEDELRLVHDLLGRLHNQKTFFRPSGTGYISG